MIVFPCKTERTAGKGIRCLARVTLACCVVMQALPAPASGQLAHQPPSNLPRGQRHEYRHEIDRLEDLWRDTILKANTTVMDSLLADDYTGITSSGMIQTKEQTLESLRSGRFQLTQLDLMDRKIRIYGTTAVVTSQAQLAGTTPSGDLSGRYRYTRVYIRNGQGQWKIVSFEASLIHDPRDSGERR